MLFPGSVKNEVPCPDNKTVSSCIGKIKFTVSSYRIARGRGRCVIRIDESAVFCNRCGRIFKVYKDTLPDSDILVWFAPTGKVKTKEQLYKMRFKR